MTDQDRGTTYPWTPGESLAEVLHLLRMRGVFYCRSEVSAPWALEMPAFEDCASFHVMVSGEAVLDVPPADENPMRLAPGDLAVVPHGAGHVIRSEPAPLHAGRVGLLPQEMIGDHCSVLRSGTGGASRGGAVRFLLDLMAEEAARMRPGGEAVLTRLADVLVILAIRQWMDSGAVDRRGWLLALRDPHIGRALAARSGYESEAAFARAFKRVTGLTPGSVRTAAPSTAG